MEYNKNRAFLAVDKTHPSAIRQKFIALTDVLDACATLEDKEYKKLRNKIINLRKYTLLGSEVVVYHEEILREGYKGKTRESRLLTMEINPLSKDGGFLYDTACQDLRNIDKLSLPRTIENVEELFL